MTRFYVCTLRLEITDDGQPRLLDAVFRPDHPPLSDAQRAHLLDLAAQKGVHDTYALAIQGDMTKAEGQTLREQLRALPDPHPANAQRQGH